MKKSINCQILKAKTGKGFFKIDPRVGSHRLGFGQPWAPLSVQNDTLFSSFFNFIMEALKYYLKFYKFAQ